MNEQTVAAKHRKRFIHSNKLSQCNLYNKQYIANKTCHLQRACEQNQHTPTNTITGVIHLALALSFWLIEPIAMKQHVWNLHFMKKVSAQLKFWHLLLRLAPLESSSREVLSIGQMVGLPRIHASDDSSSSSSVKKRHN